MLFCYYNTTYAKNKGKFKPKAEFFELGKIFNEFVINSQFGLYKMKKLCYNLRVSYYILEFFSAFSAFFYFIWFI